MIWPNNIIEPGLSFLVLQLEEVDAVSWSKALLFNDASLKDLVVEEWNFIFGMEESLSISLCKAESLAVLTYHVEMKNDINV